jgi:excisionase family DNA binding protein
MEKRGYSETEAANYIGCSARLIREQAAKGNIPVHYIGAKKLYDREDLDAFFKALPGERH